MIAMARCQNQDFRFSVRHFDQYPKGLF